MSISSAVGELIKHQGTIKYTETPDEVEVIYEPVHFVASIKLIDNRALRAKKRAVVLYKKYTFPKQLESEVCWDILYTMKRAAEQRPEMHKSWNSVFGVKWPELRISVPDEFLDTPERVPAAYRPPTKQPAIKHDFAPKGAKPPIEISTKSPSDETEDWAYGIAKNIKEHES